MQGICWLKKDAEAFQLKTDSYAAEVNVHFPADLNLLRDTLHKCLYPTEKLKITDFYGFSNYSASPVRASFCSK